MIFTLRLAQIRLGEDAACDPLIDLFLSSATIMEPENINQGLLSGKLTKTQLAELEDVSNSPHLNGLINSMESSEDRWMQLLDHP